MPFSHPIEVRFSDLDAMGHVNNALVVSYMEQARFQWWRTFLGGRKFQEAPTTTSYSTTQTSVSRTRTVKK